MDRWGPCIPTRGQGSLAQQTPSRALHIDVGRWCDAAKVKLASTDHPPHTSTPRPFSRGCMRCEGQRGEENVHVGDTPLVGMQWGREGREGVCGMRGHETQVKTMISTLEHTAAPSSPWDHPLHTEEERRKPKGCNTQTCAETPSWAAPLIRTKRGGETRQSGGYSTIARL